MATNKFKVYGEEPDVLNVFPTDDTASSDYAKLFSEGIKPNTTAKAQDVMTPLRELTIFSVSFFNWLSQTYTFPAWNPNVEHPEQSTGVMTEFKDAEVSATPGVTSTNLIYVLTSIKNALTYAITDKVNSKEGNIVKPSQETVYSNLGAILRGYLNNGIFEWKWDNTSYQAVHTTLTQIIDLFNQVSASKGFMYKASGNSTVKSTDKQFVYFDSTSEDQDDYGNYILNLYTFNYPNN